MAWVKLHDDILGDPKLMRAARVGGTELVLLPWLLAFASKAADHGRLSVGATAAEPEDIAYQTPGVTAAQVEACQRTLVAIGVLAADEDGCLRFTKWEDRQAKPSDSKSAWRERKQRSRGKAKGAKESVTPPKAGQGVTGSESGGHAGGVTPGHATEKKRGEEKRGEAEKELTDDADASRTKTIRVTPPDSPPPPPDDPSLRRGLLAWPKLDCDAGYEAFINRIGPVNYGRFRKALLPVYESSLAEHPSPSDLAGAIEAFREVREADKPQFRGKYTLDLFAQQLHEWLRLGRMQFVDEWGEPTERGRLAGMAA